MLFATIIAISLFIVFTICILVMLAVIARGGDERRKMIVDKAAATALKYEVMIQVVLSVIHLLQGKNIITINDTNTFSNLTMIAFLFVIGLMYYNQKLSVSVDRKNQ